MAAVPCWARMLRPHPGIHALAAASSVMLALVPISPVRVVWTDHALAKALLLGAARSWVADPVLEHANRERNHGAAEWRLTVDRTVIVYDCPDGDDQLTARVVTLWRRR